MDFNPQSVEISVMAKAGQAFGAGIQVLSPAFGESNTNRLGLGYASRTFQGLSQDKNKIAATGANDYEVIWATHYQIAPNFLYMGSLAGGIARFERQVEPEFVKSKMATLPYLEFRFGTALLAQEKDSPKYTMTQVGVLLRIAGLKFDVALQRVFALESVAERDVELTPVEFKILYFLASHPSTTFSREQLIQAIWRKDVHVIEENIYTHISMLRKKLGEKATCIESVPRHGYRFAAGVAPQNS